MDQTLENFQRKWNNYNSDGRKCMFGKIWMNKHLLGQFCNIGRVNFLSDLSMTSIDKTGPSDPLKRKTVGNISQYV